MIYGVVIIVYLKIMPLSPPYFTYPSFLVSIPYNSFPYIIHHTFKPVLPSFLPFLLPPSTSFNLHFLNFTSHLPLFSIPCSPIFPSTLSFLPSILALFLPPSTSSYLPFLNSTSHFFILPLYVPLFFISTFTSLYFFLYLFLSHLISVP